ncbi:uncharacterized protein LOC102801764 [Saccoglossus kowalevskii]
MQLCDNGSICFSPLEHCNGWSICEDEEDEMGCSECDDGDFLCKNGKCLFRDFSVCNYVDDCGDYSNEEHCGHYVCDNGQHVYGALGVLDGVTVSMVAIISDVESVLKYAGMKYVRGELHDTIG